MTGGQKIIVNERETAFPCISSETFASSASNCYSKMENYEKFIDRIVLFLHYIYVRIFLNPCRDKGERNRKTSMYISNV